MKKTIRLALLTCLILMVSVFTLTGCNNSVSAPESTTPSLDTQTTPNGIENNASLPNDIEQKLYNLLISEIDGFYNPASLKLISVSKSYCNGNILVVKLNADNKLGASATVEFILTLSDVDAETTYVETKIPFEHRPATPAEGYTIKKGTFYSLEYGDPYQTGFEGVKSLEYYILWQTYQYGVPENSKPNISIGKINEMLKEYKESMGW